MIIAHILCFERYRPERCIQVVYISIFPSIVSEHLSNRSTDWCTLTVSEHLLSSELQSLPQVQELQGSCGLQAGYCHKLLRLTGFHFTNTHPQSACTHSQERLYPFTGRLCPFTETPMPRSQGACTRSQGACTHSLRRLYQFTGMPVSLHMGTCTNLQGCVVEWVDTSLDSTFT